jgi:hypothetical protein
MTGFLKPASALCAVMLVAACNQQAPSDNADAEVTLDTEIKRLSYGVALGLGRNMSRDGMNVDVDALPPASVTPSAAIRSACRMKKSRPRWLPSSSV